MNTPPNHIPTRLGSRGPYRCEAASLGGFIQQLAVCYVGRGYWFYVTGRVPERKDPAAVDRKLIARYGVDVPKWTRARRKAAGLANVQYIRHGRTFVLLATHGRHQFFEDEAGQVRDARRAPIRLEGYSIGYRGGHPQVGIDREEYRSLKAYLVGRAAHRPAAELADELAHLPYEPYSRVRRQLFGALRAVNRARAAAGLDEVPWSCLRLRRRVFRPFASPPPPPQVVNL